ncbi:hypothetical protein QJS04_geneDACA004844 [Acorus gramineus]|uniref:Uncharacterized protein n=1 Tax=Acorus gramineus TaxID=55184 RepID=A0AAV9BV58_ACOGR|nr:hypothetical protein QJS04_geneDACA004844 [Acorus gramineus]
MQPYMYQGKMRKRVILQEGQHQCFLYPCFSRLLCTNNLFFTGAVYLEGSVMMGKFLSEAKSVSMIYPLHETLIIFNQCIGALFASIGKFTFCWFSPLQRIDGLLSLWKFKMIFNVKETQ